MDEQREPIPMIRDREDGAGVSTSHTSTWLAAGIVVLVIALGLTVGYIYQQQANSKQLLSHDADTNATITQLQNQIDTLTTKLNQVPATPPAPVATTDQTAAAPAAAKRRSSVENKRLKEMQAKLDDEQKQLKDTQDQVAQTRTDLEASIGSTRDDLNGSIARTHDELVSLEQRGERNYFEFDLSKAKHFQREGPIMVSLRKADPKHKRYDVALVVDDALLKKSGVNIYEPVWISGSDMQQVQLVVNKVDKDHVHGYVSAPKYLQTAGMTNVSAHTINTRADASTALPGDQSNTSDTGTSNSTSPSTTSPEQPQQ
jgi:hypothetical protein